MPQPIYRVVDLGCYDMHTALPAIVVVTNSINLITVPGLAFAGAAGD